MLNYKKIKRYIHLENQLINSVLFLFIVFFNFIFIVFWENKNLDNLVFLLGNCVIIIIFYILNFIYNKEENKKQHEIKKLLEINNLVYNKQNDIFRLFKRTYIRKNIIERDYKKLEWNFKKFIPEDFIKNISKWVNEDIKIGLSIEKELHIMFIDISGFTQISETLSSKKALLLLNIYFDWIVEISKKNWWYVDKFLWDWIMLIFDNKNSDNILNTAIEINDLVEKINIANFKNKINIWIWINSWKATLWTIWSKSRMDITIIWDSVNTASRIQDYTREEKNWILFSQETYNLIRNKKDFNISEIWNKILKWKKEKIKLFWIQSN